MRNMQAIIKRILALALTASIFLGTDGLTYAAFAEAQNLSAAADSAKIQTPSEGTPI